MKQRHVALALVLHNEHVLLTRRPAGTHLPHTWEFPGGKIEPHETPHAAATRELHEETGLLAQNLHPLTPVHHTYHEDDIHVTLHPFIAPNAEGIVSTTDEHAWVHVRDLDAWKLPAANEEIVRELRKWVVRGRDA